ncbi:outer membrane lipoprotein-sorting protein [Thiospirochaeta perfilievii]|uniref:Outer membrane lipoprotein-sorting protein n=1 Tax=Thiospirochaeta perfilievii TaxID=252967 RepID=A0A5C1QEZ1_9SPIO|nr:outer membrane lipoprotein-sorting protein [Thiospirochaeta perfilievii]QEN05967.1 outer membrane lipoprotein-sorting protein [Thiospirochaeta perfilievii]
MKKLIALLSLVFIASGVYALDGKEIATSAHNVSKSKTTHSAVSMTLVDNNGKEDVRLLEEFGKKENDLSTTVMVFRSPASVKNTRFLKQENDGSADDKWIYLPALKRVRRIASSDGSKSFMGTDFTYDDMETRDVERDIHTLLKEEAVNGVDCYVVKAEAKDLNDSQYSYRVSWIRKDNFVPIKMELYDSNKELLKVMKVLDLQNIDGFWTPMEVVMENVQTEHKTILSIKKVEFDKGVNPKVFTQSYLSSGRI